MKNSIQGTSLPLLRALSGSLVLGRWESLESQISPSILVSSIFMYPLTASPTIVAEMSLGWSFSSMRVPTSAGVSGLSLCLGGSYITAIDLLTFESLPLTFHRFIMVISETNGSKKTQFSFTSTVHTNLFHPDGGVSSPLSHPNAMVRPSPGLRVLVVKNVLPFS